ncbi:hypothetical protein Tco_0660461 [Tanacetum coccineum]
MHLLPRIYHHLHYHALPPSLPNYISVDRMDIISRSEHSHPARGCIVHYTRPDMKSERLRCWIRELGILGRSGRGSYRDTPMTMGESTLGPGQLAELHERLIHRLVCLLEMLRMETVWMVEEEAYASREAWARSIGLSQATHQELQTHRDHVYAHETYLQAHQTQYIYSCKSTSFSNSTSESSETAVQDAALLHGGNGQIRTLGPEAYSMTWECTQRKKTDNIVPRFNLDINKVVANETEKVDKNHQWTSLTDIYGNVTAAKLQDME